MKGQVDVWLAGLDDAAIGLDACAGCLSSAEHERAARFRFAHDRRRYLIAHAALRSVLAAYLSIDPQLIGFAAGSAGKPRLAEHLAGSELEFNLSHSGEVALIAVTRGKKIGVDVERVQEDFAFDPIAQRFFTANEVAALHQLSIDLQKEAFYRCWTSKEALLKAKGTGLSGALDEVHIEATGTAIRIKPVQPGWTLAELNPIPGYLSALAVEMGPDQLRCCRWEASMAANASRG